MPDLKFASTVTYDDNEFRDFSCTRGEAVPTDIDPTLLERLVGLGIVQDASDVVDEAPPTPAPAARARRTGGNA
jgi:hypothetical protein